MLHYCYATTRHLYDLVISLGLVAANRTHAGPLVLEGGNYLNKGRPQVKGKWCVAWDLLFCASCCLGWSDPLQFEVLNVCTVCIHGHWV